MTSLATTTTVEQPVATAAPSTRLDALDWTKGSLVVFMVVYHAINYSAFRPYAFRFLAFLPPSFILIAGFLVGQVYAAKYNLKSWKPYKRVATRGIKLLAVFVALNVAHCVALEHSLYGGISEFARRSSAIFLSGNGRDGVYEVLLPIAYFLLLAPGLLWLRTRASSSVGICAAAVFLLCLALERNGTPYKNLDLLSAGIIGMALGMVPMERIERLSARWILVVVLYLLYRLCSFSMGDPYPVQTFGAVVTVLLLYCCADHMNLGEWFGPQVILLGRYTLLGYLVQIAILQAAVKIFGGRPAQVAGVVAFGVATVVLTYFIVWAVHGLRQVSHVVDAAYKTVFA
jgi:hypothetical protein